ncbi:unnamed protein product [Rhizophagus irregularis]|nr:ribonuclease H1-like isoform X2 [Rhizophagus irregularis DAOM 181602=DAOM 197198]CAB4489918.1 unnamed protein product [Rhizophagus irregularis]CAB5377663.1 unnamed protein product [Rhizophagus irregularis]CAG8514095.1 748_t:CDS:2 [Rhizophagus irregularis]
MPKVKSGFYAVHIGFKPGVYHSWEECEKQIKKYPNAKYKKFNTLQEAEAFVKEGNNKKVFGNSTRETPISKYISSKQQNTSSSASNVSNEKSLKVWTDGSSINNGQHGAKAGIGVYWGKDDPRNISERLPGPRQTNNRAEIMAVIRALETCPDNNIPLEIRTDSQYVINAYKSWIPKWEKNNKWKASNNKDVENKELFQRLMKLVRARNAEVTIEYVQGHVGVQENEEADQLAKLGAFMDTVDDLYDYGDDETEIKRQHTILQYFQTITDESSPPSIVENSQILLNNFEYNKNILAKDDSN